MGSFAAVFIGGMLGTALRLGLDALLPHSDDGFPLSTLLINGAGSLLLGFLVARLWPNVRPWLRAGLGAGLLGGFTTFSALVVSLVSLLAAGQGMLAALHLGTSMLAGLAGAAAGLAIGARTVPPIGVEE